MNPRQLEVIVFIIMFEWSHLHAGRNSYVLRRSFDFTVIPRQLEVIVLMKGFEIKFSCNCDHKLLDKFFGFE